MGNFEEALWQTVSAFGDKDHHVRDGWEGIVALRSGIEGDSGGVAAVARAAECG